jgi:hypothetical protein
MSMKQFSGSASLLNMRRNSSCSTAWRSPSANCSMCCSASKSPSAFDSSYSSLLSASSLLRWSMVPTTVSSDFFSRPSSWARLGSFQTAGFSSAALTSFSRRALRS